MNGFWRRGFCEVPRRPCRLGVCGLVRRDVLLRDPAVATRRGWCLLVNSEQVVRDEEASIIECHYEHQQNHHADLECLLAVAGTRVIMRYLVMVKNTVPRYVFLSTTAIPAPGPYATV